jgi:hypothetical protein
VPGLGNQTPLVRTTATAFSFVPFSGNLTVGGDISSGSDVNLKRNIEQIENALRTISSIRGVKFEWKKTGSPSIGVIAQEVEEILPELVKGSESKTVNYSGLIAVLIEAVKELRMRVEVLEQNLK